MLCDWVLLDIVCYVLSLMTELVCWCVVCCVLLDLVCCVLRVVGFCMLCVKVDDTADRMVVLTSCLLCVVCCVLLDAVCGG